MLKTLAAALLLTSALATAAPAAQPIVTKIEKNADGSLTFYFSIKIDQDETMQIGEGKSSPDFVTVYNFYGLVDGSVKTPPGWEFTSEDFGRTPVLDGYPLVAPVDIPNTPNLTWTATKPVPAGTEVTGFMATTKVAGTVTGQYSAQVTRQIPAIPGVLADMPGGTATTSKQAQIGSLPTPRFLIDVK